MKFEFYLFFAFFEKLFQNIFNFFQNIFDALLILLIIILIRLFQIWGLILRIHFFFSYFYLFSPKKVSTIVQ